MLPKSYSHSNYQPPIRIIDYPYIFLLSIINHAVVRFPTVNGKGVRTLHLSHTIIVVLAPGNLQEQSQINTNMTHAKENDMPYSCQWNTETFYINVE